MRCLDRRTGRAINP
ncbi:hypothetical protein EME83_19140 [Klebsiella pneumoniae]|nr:hypothetical protein EME83_19140 [Klebsiella pneumoniae]